MRIRIRNPAYEPATTPTVCDERDKIGTAVNKSKIKFLTVRVRIQIRKGIITETDPDWHQNDADPQHWKPMYTRGLQCFKLNGNHTEKDRYWQKNNFLLFAKCLKMYSFFRICILSKQKVLL
jgi:hypothetical protein